MIAFFEMVVSNDLLCFREIKLRIQKKMSKDLAASEKLFPELCRFQKIAKKYANKSFNSKISLFYKIYDFNNLSGVEKPSYKLNHTCQSTFWSLSKCYSISAIVGKMTKRRPKCFLREEIFFFKKFASIDFFGSK